MKNVINSFSRDLWLSNLAEGWLMIGRHMSNNKVTYPSDHAVAWGHLTNELHYIFILRSLLPLNLTERRLVELKSPRQFNNFIFCLLSKFWLNWKNPLSEDTLFLKHFYCSINFLKNISVDQVVLKIRVLNQKKKINQHYGKIPEQEFK